MRKIEEEELALKKTRIHQVNTNKYIGISNTRSDLIPNFVISID